MTISRRTGGERSVQDLHGVDGEPGGLTGRQRLNQAAGDAQQVADWMPFSSSCVMRGSPLVASNDPSRGRPRRACRCRRAGRRGRRVPREPGAGIASPRPSMAQCLVHQLASAPVPGEARGAGSGGVLREHEELAVALALCIGERPGLHAVAMPQRGGGRLGAGEAWSTSRLLLMRGLLLEGSGMVVVRRRPRRASEANRPRRASVGFAAIQLSAHVLAPRSGSAEAWACRTRREVRLPAVEEPAVTPFEEIAGSRDQARLEQRLASFAGHGRRRGNCWSTCVTKSGDGRHGPSCPRSIGMGSASS